MNNHSVFRKVRARRYVHSTRAIWGLRMGFREGFEEYIGACFRASWLTRLPFHHSFNKYFLGTYYLAGTVLGTRNSTVNKTSNDRHPGELIFWKGRGGEKGAYHKSKYIING